MTHHTWRRHLTIWLLHLGVLWLPLSSLTADLNKACKSHAAGKFQIRAMTYTNRYFYLVDSHGQLFVKSVAPFLVGINASLPTIELNKPIFSLPTQWYGVDEPVDYAEPALQFGFTNDLPDDSRQDRLTLRMINYLDGHTYLTDKNLDMYVYRGFQVKGREVPASMENKSSFWSIASDSKPTFWLSDKWSMYPIQLLDGGTKMEIPDLRYDVQANYLQVKQWNTDVVRYLGTFGKPNVKPQSGLLTEEVIFIASEDSTGHFLTVDKSSRLWYNNLPLQSPPLGIYPKYWPLSVIIKLRFCQIETPMEPKGEAKDEPALPIMEEDIALLNLSKDSINPKTTAPSRKILYLALAGIVLIVLALAVYARMNWWEKKKNPKKSKKRGKSSKKRDKASKTTNFWGSIGGLLAKVSPCKAKVKPKEILASKVRQSIMVTSMASAASKARQSAKRRKKGSKVGPTSRASRRSAVSGVLTGMQKGLLAFKALLRHPKPKPKLISTASTASPASTASTACTASLVSSLAETQSLDYHF